MPIDAPPLRNAVQRLREGLARHRAEPTDEQLRDGLIQRFEFTYELSHKTLRRYLQDILPSAETFALDGNADFCRAGARGERARAAPRRWPAWRHFRDIRARTTHTYDADTASEVAREIPIFLEEVEYLHAELEKRVG